MAPKKLQKMVSALKWPVGLAGTQELRHAAKKPQGRFRRLGTGASRLYCKLAHGKTQTAAQVAGEVDMGYVVMLQGAEPKEILQAAIDREVPAIMSYLSRGKWHIAKVVLTSLGDGCLDIESMRSDRKQQPINIQLNQPVGISFKHEYGKYVFDTTVQDLKASPDPAGGGTIVVAVPEQIEVVQRRSYFRVNVPESLKVNMVMWHRRHKNHQAGAPAEEGEYFQGRLIDISAGGAQVAIDRGASGQEPDFRVGQFVGVRFTPLPYETPLMLSAQVRTILPRSDGQTLCLGLQIVGLEASLEGREILTRLVGVVEQYYRLGQSEDARQEQDMSEVPVEASTLPAQGS